MYSCERGMCDSATAVFRQSSAQFMGCLWAFASLTRALQAEVVAELGPQIPVVDHDCFWTAFLTSNRSCRIMSPSVEILSSHMNFRSGCCGPPSPASELTSHCGSGHYLASRHGPVNASGFVRCVHLCGWMPGWYLPLLLLPVTNHRSHRAA